MTPELKELVRETELASIRAELSTCKDPAQLHKLVVRARELSGHETVVRPEAQLEQKPPAFLAHQAPAGEPTPKPGPKAPEDLRGSIEANLQTIRERLEVETDPKIVGELAIAARTLRESLS